MAQTIDLVHGLSEGPLLALVDDESGVTEVARILQNECKVWRAVLEDIHLHATDFGFHQFKRST